MASVKQHVALVSVHGDPAVEIGKEEAGGQNVYVRQVGEALARQGWQVEMFTRQSHSDRPSIVEHSSNCRTIRLTAGPEDFVPRDELFDYLPTFVDRLLEFQEHAGVRYQLVHTNYWLSAWVGMALKKHQKIAQVHTHHSLGAVKYRTVASKPPIASVRLETEQACIETAERAIATSSQEVEDMRSLVTPKGNIDVIPCGTDIERFGSISKLDARQKLGLDPNAKIAFYIGRFDPRKGIETLVRAIHLSELRNKTNFQLIIGGGSRPGQADGRERERIEQIVDELGLRSLTHFPGRIPDELMPAYYAAADVCAVPSHYEPFGLVALEAMASRTPVVASQVGGLQYSVVSEETGLLVPPQEDAAWAASIDRILSDETWQKQLGQAARARVVRHFSWESVASNLARLYTQLLESSLEK
ncbi:MAG: glycosyltransferase family 1 protein [Cyanobacteriota bacterium]|nr:glycosyltransferase family 1 protein [Cyanobacteriota bacterium]